MPALSFCSCLRNDTRSRITAYPMPMTVGRMDIPVVPTSLPAGTYWMMGVYDADASIGIDEHDPDAPDWEVVEVKGGSAEVACDNLTEAEAKHMAEMWSRKRDEAEP